MYDKILLWWKDKNIKTDADLAEALNGHIVSFAYNSGKIENDNVTYHDTREIFETDGVTSYTGDLRTLYELRNAKTASEYFLQCFGQQTSLSEAFIKKLQKILTMNTYDSRRWQKGERPGTYKLGDYVTGKDEIVALAEDVPAEMQELINDMETVPNSKALIAAAFFHAKMENIHPFADGNGRTGRLAMNYFLVCHNHPPIVIHEEDRREYFQALEAWDNDQDLNPLIDFLRSQTVKTWKKQLDKSDKTKRKLTLTEILSKKKVDILQKNAVYLHSVFIFRISFTIVLHTI